MEVLVARAAGLDVHKDSIVACVRLAGEGGTLTEQVRTFGTMSGDLAELADWLAEHQVSRVGMESTGMYWRAPYFVLEDRFDVQVLNAQHIHNVPGRKTDVQDAQWIARLVQYGLVRGGFVPPPQIRQLRTLTRYRRTQTEERVREAQRLEKVLQDAGLKLSSVASDILGRSGRAILDAIVAGERDPDILAGLAQRALRRKIPQLRRALTGRISDAHVTVLRTILAKIDYLDGLVAELDAQIEKLIAPFQVDRDLLTSIPGLNRTLAAAIIAEIGVDMTVWGQAGRLASWAGMSPGQHESAGKRMSGRCRYGDSWLQRALILAATSAAHTKNTYLAAQYARLVPRRGARRARKAVAHSILVAIFHMLAGGVGYHELGADYFTRRRDPDRQARQNLNTLRSLGWTVTETDTGVTLTRPGKQAA